MDDHDVISHLREQLRAATDRAEKAEANWATFCKLMGRDTATDRALDDLEITANLLASLDGSLDEQVLTVLAQRDRSRERARKLREVANSVFVVCGIKESGTFGPWRCMDCVGESDTGPHLVVHGRHRNGTRDCVLAEFEDLK